MADSNKTAIVTGASQGIGAELLETFLKRGYNVVATSRNITKANPFAASPNLALIDRDIGDAKAAGESPSPSTRPTISTRWFPRRWRVFSIFHSLR